MGWMVLQMALYLLVASVATAEEGKILKEYFCPESFTCAGCPSNWIYPDIEYSGNFDGEACNVTFTWNWVQEDDTNPLLVFLCSYDDGSSCEVGNEQQCGSCQNFTIRGVVPSKNPVVSYSDTCGNMKEFPIGDSCSVGTEATTKFTTETTAKPTTEKTAEPTTNVTTNSTVLTTMTTASTTGGDTTTSVGDLDCPDTSLCSGCPLDWEIPNFQLSGTPAAGGLCDVEIAWLWEYPPNLETNPVVNFMCIYGVNGEFCETKSQSACGSCQRVSFDNIDLTYHPYIDIADTCGNLGQIHLTEDCSNLGIVPPQPTSPSVGKYPKF